MTVEVILEAEDTVGESVVWDDRRGQLVWVDIGGRRIQRLDMRTRARALWSTGTEFPTSIGLRADGGAVVGLTRRVALWEWGGSFETLAVPEPETTRNRLNEGRVAPDGSFWVGTMENNLGPAGEPVDISGKKGRLWRIDQAGRVEALSGDLFGITNTMVWLPDGRFVTADTTENSLYAYDRTPDGRLGDRRPFGSPFERGLPDGSCLDAEGCVWTCRVVGGACLVRTAPDGTVDRVIDLPVTWPTSCTFGGSGLDRLFVTSARFTMTAEHLARNRLEGSLLAVDPGVRGVLENRFGKAS